MRKCILVIGLLSLAFTNANSASAQAESCDQIRTLIKAQTGVPPKTNTELLQKLARPECRFSATEVYRAACGDKPMPINDVVRYRTRRDHDEDHD
jgi:hypothetical protein